jgi:selenophosphate synthase
MKMRKEMIEATRQHAIAHIQKHKMNVEIYLTNPVGIGEHSDIMDAIEKELTVMAEYQDHLEMLDLYFKE